MKNNHYQICTKTIMDTSDPSITFDANGVCNYWHEYQEFVANLNHKIGPSKEKKLNSLVSKLKKVNNKYNCLIGISGGIDSTFVALKAKELGLNPLAVHFDGGWDNEYGAHNMKVIERSLNLDIYNLKVNFDEIRDLLVAYLKASVIDIGIYADHAIHATMYNLAMKHNIKTVLIGSNYLTEFIAPKPWVYNKFDLVNLNHIHKKFGRMKRLPTYPTYGFWKQVWFQGFYGLEVINFMNYLDFNTNKVEETLRKELDWKPYPRKHGESLFTVFYQNYILPRKFGIDKRKMHLSSQILSGEITREAAIEEMKKPLYTEEQLNHDKTIVLNKLQLTEDEFESIMNLPIRSHKDYRTDSFLRKNYMKTLKLTKPLRRIF